MAKPKLSKDEQNQNNKYEKKLREQVSQIEAVDNFLEQGEGQLKDFKDLQAWYKRFKTARGENYKKDEISEIKVEVPKSSGNNKKAK
jgi:hypothetical protein